VWNAAALPVASISITQIVPILRTNIRRQSDLMTDEARHYRGVGQEFESHGTINHGEEEYVHGNISTNTVESYYSIFKRGMKGVYQHCSEQHLHRYLAEFDFRDSNRIALGVDDRDRADKTIRGMVGKRLTYRVTDKITQPKRRFPPKG
jgi:hypothetical protein